MYQDNTVNADDTGITISRFGLTGGGKRISYEEISSATVFDMGLAGRWRLIGAGPKRFRSWYNWDRSRRDKTRAIAIDTGGFFRPTFTPDDIDAFIAVISIHVKVT